MVPDASEGRNLLFSCNLRLTTIIVVIAEVSFRWGHEVNVFKTNNEATRHPFAALTV